jgi:hypothetical protein
MRRGRDNPRGRLPTFAWSRDVRISAFRPRALKDNEDVSDDRISHLPSGVCRDAWVAHNGSRRRPFFDEGIEFQIVILVLVP